METSPGKKSRFKLKRKGFSNSDSYRDRGPSSDIQKTPEPPVMSYVESKVPPIAGENGDKATPVASSHAGSDLWDWDDTEKLGDDAGVKLAADSDKAADETPSAESAKPADEPDRKIAVSLVDYEFDSSSAEENQDASSGDDKDAGTSVEKVQIEGNINCDNNGVEKDSNPSSDLPGQFEGKELDLSRQETTSTGVAGSNDDRSKPDSDEKEAKEKSDKKGCNLRVQINKGTGDGAEKEDVKAAEPSSGGTTKSPGSLTMQNLEILQKMAENLAAESKDGPEEKSGEEVPVQSTNVKDKVEMDVKSEKDENLDEKEQEQHTAEVLDKEGDVVKLESEGLSGGSGSADQEMEEIDVSSSKEDGSVTTAVDQGDAESELPGGEVPVVAGAENVEGKGAGEELDRSVTTAVNLGDTESELPGGEVPVVAGVEDVEGKGAGEELDRSVTIAVNLGDTESELPGGEVPVVAGVEDVEGKDTGEELDSSSVTIAVNQGDTESELPGGDVPVVAGVEDVEGKDTGEELDSSSVTIAVNQGDTESELPGGDVPVVAGAEDVEGKDTREELDKARVEVQQVSDHVAGEDALEEEVSELEAQKPSGVGSEWKSSPSAESSSDGPELASPGTTQKVWGALRSEVGDVVDDIDSEMDSFVKDIQPKETSQDKETLLSQNDSVSNDQETADNSYSSLPKTFGGFKPRKRTFNVNFPIPESYRAVLRLTDVFTTMKHLTGSVYATPEIVRIDPLILKEHFGEEFVAGFFDSATSEEEDYILSKKVTEASGGDNFEKKHVEKELSADVPDGRSGSTKAVAKKKGRGRTPKMFKSVGIERTGKKFQSEIKAEETQNLQKTPVSTKPKASASDLREKEPDTPPSQASHSELSFNFDNTPGVKLVGIFDSPSAKPPPPIQKGGDPALTRLCHGGGRGTLNVGGGNSLLNQSKWWENIPKKKVRKVLNRSVGEASEVESTASFDSLGRVSPFCLPVVEEEETKPKVVPVKKIPMAKKSTGGNKQSKLLGESQKPNVVKSVKKVPMAKIKKEKPDKTPKKRLVKDHNNIKNLFDLMSLGRLEIIVERCDAMLDSSVVIVKKEKGDNSFVDIEGVDESYEPFRKRGRPKTKSKSPARRVLSDSESDSGGGGATSSDLGTKEVSYENFLKDECESSLSDGKNVEQSDSDYEHRKRARLKKLSGSEDVSVDDSASEEKSVKKKPRSNKGRDKKDRSENNLNIDSDSESDSFKMMKKPSDKIGKKTGRGRRRKEVEHSDADEKPKKKRKKLLITGDALPDFSSTDDEIGTDTKPDTRKIKSPKQVDKKVSSSRHFSRGLIGAGADFSSDEEKVGSSTGAEGLKFQIAGLVDSPRLWGDDQEPPRQGHGVTRQDSAPIFIQCTKSTTSVSTDSDSDAPSLGKKDKQTKKKSRDTDARKTKEEKSKAFDAVKKLGPKSKQGKKSDSLAAGKKDDPKNLKLDKVIKSEALEEKKKLDPKLKAKVSSKDDKEQVIKDLVQDPKGSTKKVAPKEVDWIPKTEESKTDKKVSSGSESDVEVLPSPPRPAAEVVKISSDSQDSDVDVHSIPTTESSAPFVDVEMGFSSEDDDVSDDVMVGDAPEQSEKETGDQKTLEKSSEETIKLKTIVTGESLGSKETVKKASEQDLLKEHKILPINVKLTRLNSEVRRILRKRKHISIHRYEKLTGVKVHKKAPLERRTSSEKHKKVRGSETDKKSSSDTLIKQDGKDKSNLEKSSGKKSFLESLQDEYDSSPERPAKDKGNEMEKRADVSSAESEPGFPGSDVEITVLDEVGGDTCSSGDAAEALTGASDDKQSSDEEVKRKSKKRVLSDSDNDDEPAAPSTDDKSKHSDDEASGKKNTPEVDETKEEDGRESPKKEAAESRKKVSAKEESMKKLKMSKKKQKTSGSSLNEILFGGGPVFGENVTPSLSTFKIPKREEKGKKGAGVKEQPDKRSKIDIVKEALEKSRMEERKRNLMKRKEQEEKAKQEQNKKRSRFDAAIDTPDRNQTRRASDMDRRGLSDKDRRENLDRRDTFGNRGNWRGGPDRRDAYGRRDLGNDLRRDSDSMKREPDPRNRFSDPRNARDSNPRSSRESQFNRGGSSRPPYTNVEGRGARFDNPPTPIQPQNIVQNQNQNMGNINYATPRTYKEYKESLVRGGSGSESQPLLATPPQQDIPNRDVLTSTPRGVGVMRKRSPSPPRDQILRDGRNIRPVHNEHLTHRQVNRLLQHEEIPDLNPGMPSPIDHSSPSDIGSHDFIGPHTPEMPEAEDMDQSPEMKASILSLLTGKNKQGDGYHSFGEDNIESDDDMDMQRKGFKRPLVPVKKLEQGRNEPHLRARSSNNRDHLVLSAPDDEDHTEEWFDSIMATVGDTEEEEDVLSLYAPSECSFVNKGDKNRDTHRDTPLRRGNQESPLKRMMTEGGPGRGREVDSRSHRGLSQESRGSQEDTIPQQRAYAKSMMSALQDQTTGPSGSQQMNMREFIQTSLRRREEDLAQARSQSLAQAKVTKIMQGLMPDDERALVRSAIYLKDNLDETVDLNVVRTALQNIKMKSLMEARGSEHAGPQDRRSEHQGQLDRRSEHQGQQDRWSEHQGLQERQRERSPEGKLVDRNVAKSTLFALQAHKDPPKQLSPVYTTPASFEDQCSPALSDWSRHSGDSVKKSRESAAQNFAKTLNTPLMQSMLKFGNASDQGQGNASDKSDNNLDLSLPNRGRDVPASGGSTPSIDLDFPLQEEKPFEEHISGLRALLPKVLRPDISNYKISKTIPKGHCYKFIKLGSCPNPHCSYSHVIPAEPVIGDIRACHRGNDLLGAAEAYAFLKTKCGKKEVRPDVVACMVEMCHKTGLIEMVFQVLLPDIKELKLLNTRLCDALIAMCFPKHRQHLWEIFCFFKECEEKAIPSHEKIFDLMKDLFMRHDFEKVLIVMQHWSTAEIDLNPILDLALNSDAHLNGVVLIIDKLPKPSLVKLNTKLLADLQDRCHQCCHPHGVSVLQQAISKITASQKPPPQPVPLPQPVQMPLPVPLPPAPVPEVPSNNHVLKDLNDSLVQLLGAGKLKDALSVFQKMLTINNTDKVAASACGIDMNFVFNQMLMAAVKNMDTRMLLMIFSIGNKGSTLNPQEAMYRLLIIHCVRTNNDGKADLLYKMSPAQKQSVVNIPRKLTFNSNLSMEEIRVIMKSYMIDLCRLLRASGKLSSKNIEDFVIDVIVKKVDTNAGGVKVLAAIQNTVDAVNQRIIKVFRHMNPPITAEVNPTSKKIDITPESVRVHLGALERLCTTSGKNIVFGAKGPQTPKTPGANASTTPKATPPAPGKQTPPGATPRI